MFWFDLLFPPLMILFPGLFILAVRTPPDVTIDRPRVRTLTTALWLCTTLALAVFGLAFAVWPGHAVARHLWVLCWLPFGVILALLPAKNPNYQAHDPATAARTASLANRERANPIGRGWWLLAWAMWTIGVGGVCLRLAGGQESIGWPRWMLSLLLPLLAAFCPILAWWGVRRTLVEPEPMNSGGSLELAEEYARNRRFRAWSFYGLFGLAMPSVFLAVAFAAVWLPMTPATGAALGIGGAVAGSLVGVAGGIFGTVASIRRARINALLRRLESGSSNSPAIGA